MQPKTFLEQVGIQDAVHDAIKDAVKSYAKAVTKEALKDQLSTILQDLSADLAGAFLGSISSTLLKSLLNIQNKVAVNLNKLIREPFETGTRVAQEALSYTWKDEDERLFRERQLHFAIQKIEEAITLSRGSKEYQRELIYLLLLQGLCSNEIRGGQPLVRQRFSAVAKTLESESQKLYQRAEEMTKIAQDSKIKADRLAQRLEGFPENNKDLLYGVSPLRQRELVFIAETEQRSRDALELNAKADEMRMLSTVLRAVVNRSA